MLFFINHLGTDMDVPLLSVDQIREIHPYRCPNSAIEAMILIPIDEEIKEFFLQNA